MKHKEKPAEKARPRRGAQKRDGHRHGGHAQRRCKPRQIQRKYTSLAATKNVENRRKPMPAGNKQKFSGGKNRFGGRGPQGKKRETEAERLQRIQLERPARPS